MKGFGGGSTTSIDRRALCLRWAEESKQVEPWFFFSRESEGPNWSGDKNHGLSWWVPSDFRAASVAPDNPPLTGLACWPERVRDYDDD